MDEKTLKKLGRLLNSLETDYASSEEVAKIVADILNDIDLIRTELKDSNSSVSVELNRILSDFNKLNKSADYSKSYFLKEIDSLKQSIKNIQIQHGKDGQDGRDGRDADIAEVLRVVDEKISNIKPTEIVPETSSEVIEKINKEKKKKIKKDRIEGLDELERKADFALSRPLIQGVGGGASGIREIRAGSNITASNVNGVVTISSTVGSSSDTLQTVTEKGATTTILSTFNGGLTIKAKQKLTLDGI